MRDSRKEQFLACFKFPPPAAAQTQRASVPSASQTVSKVSTLIQYIQVEVKEQQKAFSLYFKVRTFLQICQKTDKWLKNPVYHQRVKSCAYRLMDELYRQKEMMGDSKSQQSRELGELYGAIQAKEWPLYQPALIGFFNEIHQQIQVSTMTTESRRR